MAEVPIRNLTIVRIITMVFAQVASMFMLNEYGFFRFNGENSYLNASFGVVAVSCFVYMLIQIRILKGLKKIPQST